ncbi:ImmA/IrrE family metallo-endopeptidase [Agrobacterium rhizogenes]|uniref:ImmA/IrrE family metallo-endopeptidase n=1 Tax=Rhizobium rhizogenes TaxID=359 RepID=UPI0022B727BC|nr:ImmA/IrrE family metallo-endopeptidase [Rhizobium rhizogenes]MCZ7446295.1 ImmA/IrrE family metallo-endopeptidase [Rhizobium rhizogenes]
MARQFNATVWDERDILGLPDIDLKQLTVNDAQSWSAFTLRINQYHLILFNSSQSAPRINSVIMHELAHIALGHELHSASLSDDGHLVPSNYSQDQEDEADWLGGTLLLPRPALLKIRREGLSEAAAMAKFQASKEMLTWRFRMTGVDSQLGYGRQRVIV